MPVPVDKPQGRGGQGPAEGSKTEDKPRGRAGAPGPGPPCHPGPYISMPTPFGGATDTEHGTRNQELG